jgi:hypothetical protein
MLPIINKIDAVHDTSRASINQDEQVSDDYGSKACPFTKAKRSQAFYQGCGQGEKDTKVRGSQDLSRKKG